MFRKFIAGLVVVTTLLSTHVLAAPPVCHTTIDKTEGYKSFVIDYGATYHITIGGAAGGYAVQPGENSDATSFDIYLAHGDVLEFRPGAVGTNYGKPVGQITAGGATTLYKNGNAIVTIPGSGGYAQGVSSHEYNSYTVYNTDGSSHSTTVHHHKDGSGAEHDDGYTAGKENTAKATAYPSPGGCFGKVILTHTHVGTNDTTSANGCYTKPQTVTVPLEGCDGATSHTHNNSYTGVPDTFTGVCSKCGSGCPSPNCVVYDKCPTSKQETHYFLDCSTGGVPLKYGKSCSYTHHEIVNPIQGTRQDSTSTIGCTFSKSRQRTPYFSLQMVNCNKVAMSQNNGSGRTVNDLYWKNNIVHLLLDDTRKVVLLYDSAVKNRW